MVPQNILYSVKKKRHTYTRQQHQAYRMSNAKQQQQSRGTKQEKNSYGLTRQVSTNTEYQSKRADNSELLAKFFENIPVAHGVEAAAQ